MIEFYKMGVIYKITNPDNKTYIGQTINLKNRIRSYKYLKCKLQPKIYNSIKKYGWDNHTFEIIESFDMVDDIFEKLNRSEIKWIEKFDSLKNGLNCDIGGKNAPCSDETKKKISDSKIGSIVSEETRIKLSIINKGRPSNRRGAKLSKNHLLSLFNSNKGRVSTLRKKIECSNGEIYNSISEASVILGIARVNINLVCLNKRKSAGGLKFNYLYE